jgi:hypothetical protein
VARLLAINSSGAVGFIGWLDYLVATVSSLFDAESSDLADDFDNALREARWKPLRIKNRTVLAFGIAIATVERTAAAQICTRKQDNEPTK